MNRVFKNKKMLLVLTGLVCGFLNGFFGAGGGSIAVPLLRGAGVKDKSAHATSVLIILCTTLVSVSFYLYRGTVRISDALPFIYAGVFGALFGSFVLKKISLTLLRRIFGALIVFTSIRMLLK